MQIRQSSLKSLDQILRFQLLTVRKYLQMKGFRSMFMIGPKEHWNLVANFCVIVGDFRFVLITIPFSKPTRNQLPIIGSYWSAVMPIALKGSARSGSSTSISSSSVGRFSRLISHHLTVPSVDAEKNSVLFLEWIQSAWVTGFLCATSADHIDRSDERLRFGSKIRQPAPRARERERERESSVSPAFDVLESRTKDFAKREDHRDPRFLSSREPSEACSFRSRAPWCKYASNN